MHKVALPIYIYICISRLLSFCFVLFSKNNAKSEMGDNGSGKGIKVPNTSHFQNGGSYSMLEALVGYFLFLSDIFLKSTILKSEHQKN